MNNMKRVLIVTQYIYPETFKSSEMAFEFAKRGYHVDVLTGIPNYPEGHYYKGYGLFSKRTEIKDVVLLGGEPMEEENQKALLPFLSKVRERCPDKNIWIYSGFTFEEILGKVKSRAFTPISRRILELCDVLVDGRFIIEDKDISLQFRGSRNQRIIDLKSTFEKGEIVLWKDSFSS